MKRMIKSVLISLVSSKIGQAIFPVFLAHGVVPNPGDFFQGGYDNIDPDNLRKQIRFLKKHYEFISLYDAIKRVESREDLKGKCALTFDDGYACLHHHAFPILEEENVPATVFIISDVVDDAKVFWRDCVRSIIVEGKERNFLEFCKENYAGDINLPKGDTIIKHWTRDASLNGSHIVQKAVYAYCDQENIVVPYEDQTGCSSLYLTREQISDAPSCVEFGNHTASHPVLPSLSREEQRQEIMQCKDFLDTVEKSVPILSLPFGMYNDDTLSVAQESGYRHIAFHSANRVGSLEGLKKGYIERYSLPANDVDLAWLLAFQKHG